MDDANDVRDDQWITELLAGFGCEEIEVSEQFFTSLETRLDEAAAPVRGRVDELFAEAVVELLNLGGTALGGDDEE